MGKFWGLVFWSLDVFCSETHFIISSPTGTQFGNSSVFWGSFHPNICNLSSEIQRQSKVEILQKDTKIFWKQTFHLSINPSRSLNKNTRHLILFSINCCLTHKPIKNGAKNHFCFLIEQNFLTLFSFCSH